MYVKRERRAVISYFYSTEGLLIAEGLEEVAPTDLGAGHRYTGAQLDAGTGLQANLTRGYDPSVGQWTTQDPVGFAPDGNLYRYVAGPELAGVSLDEDGDIAPAVERAPAEQSATRQGPAAPERGPVEAE